METIEIRVNKKKILLLPATCLLLLLASAYFTFFMEHEKNKNIIQVTFFVFLASSIYLFYRMYQVFKNKEPFLRITRSYLEINERGYPVSFMWTEISDWYIKNDDGTHYLLIKPEGKKKKRVNISWLEKKPLEVELILQQFDSRPPLTIQ